MKLIAGLGNPGEKFENTRHNAGFMAADMILSDLNSGSNWEDSQKFKSLVCLLQSEGLILAKPQTFMNDSGEAIGAITTFYKVKPIDLYVIHDDLDILLGEYKIQFGTGPKVHNGINSVEEKSGTKDFWRIRVGIENRQTKSFENAGKMSGEEYVLQKFSVEELAVVEKVISEIIAELKSKSII